VCGAERRCRSGTLTVKTWDRPNVQVESNGRVGVQRLSAAETDARLPRQYTVWSQTVPTQHGNLVMPEESFLLPRMDGAHQGVVARGSGNTTVMIPRGTALLTADVGNGNVNISNYRGNFVTQAGTGSVALNHVSGTGFVQSLGGPVRATDSTFDRLRVRTATGNMTFRGCTAHQIEASSTYGSITYDNGRFQPGLAHFESVHGNVALGVQGGARIGTRSGPQTTQATFRGGGPMVTAVSKKGRVYIYNGSLRAHPRVQAEMRAARAAARSARMPYQPPMQYQPQRYAPAPQRERRYDAGGGRHRNGDRNQPPL
jgi:hypothetical protein